MQTKSSRPWGVATLLGIAFCLFVTVTGWLLAAPSPAEEITQAVAASGKSDVKKADPETFLNAFSSVLVNTDKESSLAYVAAAKSLRPDLSERITATAVEVDSEPADADGNDRHRVSRHRRHCPVCHRDVKHHFEHTIQISCRRVPDFLERHPDDRRGACPHSTPPPHASS